MAFVTSMTGVAIRNTCTSYPGMVVSITVPSDGTIVVSVNVVEVIDHNLGVRDTHWIKISDASGDCVADQWTFTFTVDNELPDDDVWPTISMQRVESVTAGTYTYYVNGRMVTGFSGLDEFVSGSMVAVFYPS